MKKNNYKIFNSVQNLKLSTSQLFNQSTFIDKFADSSKKYPKEWTKTYYKGYPRFSAFKLKEPSKLNISLDEALINRLSTRNYSKKPINFQDLSNILYYSAGENKKRTSKEINYRFYPSGGARYPLEIYPIIRKKSEIDEGIYHYYVRNNLLEKFPNKGLSDKFLKEAFAQPTLLEASVLLVVSAIFLRTQIKYNERGYRLVLMELGNLCQNIYLTCSALNIGCCEINGFNDNLFNDLLGIDGLRESTMIVMALGHKNI